jgi:hypothetical protein
MLELYFEGWFQCRLARDPDPTDEKRGISGAAFATVYEPDLDRIIRLNDPIASRAMYMPAGHNVPEAGVSVKSVYIHGEKSASHPLVGARVDLLENAVFESLNGVFYQPGNEPIDPFHICVSQGDLLVSRKDLLDLAQRKATMYDFSLTSPFLQRRQPVSSEVQSVDVREATGIYNPDAYIKKRISDLRTAIEERENAKQNANDDDGAELDLQIAGLKQRLAALTIPPELDQIFESQIPLEVAQALDGRQSKPEILLSDMPEAAQLVEEFNKRDIKFSPDAVFVAQASNSPASRSDDPAFKIHWMINDPLHWVNPYLGKQPQLDSGQLESILYLPAQFRIDKALQRGSAYAIIAFQELEVWQNKVFKILLGTRLGYQFDIRGPSEIQGDLGLVVADDLPWPISFWLGAWDNDALSGYMKGCLQIPLKRGALT